MVLSNPMVLRGCVLLRLAVFSAVPISPFSSDWHLAGALCLHGSLSFVSDGHVALTEAALARSTALPRKARVFPRTVSLALFQLIGASSVSHHTLPGSACVSLIARAEPPADSHTTARRWRMYRSLILDTAPIYPLAIHLGHAVFCITSFREWRSGQTTEEPSWMHNLVCSYFCFGFGAPPPLAHPRPRSGNPR